MVDQDRFVATGSAYDRPEPSINDDLVRVGRGTPMGEVLRRYWHPVFKSDKLTDLPVQVRALGEDVILFRKPSGDVGAVYPRCIHRGTTLLYGRVTDIGIRCCYHGWTFETDGRCTDQPCEPDRGGARREKYRQPWYPVAERYGLIFIYQGPLDRKPPLPRYDILESIPDGWEIVADDTTLPSAGAGYMPCNWLQHHENGMDPHHVAIVHEHQFPPIMAQAESIYKFEKLKDRVRGHGVSKIGPMMMDFRVDLVFPNVRVIPDPLLANQRPDGKADSVAWTLPKDDEDTIVFTALAKPKGVPSLGNSDLYNGKAWHDLSFEEHQRFPGDFEAQVGQGVITYHSEEHLVTSDKGIGYLRWQLRDAIKTIAEGRDPPLAYGPAEILIETWAGVRMSPNPDFAPSEDAVSIAILEAPAQTENAATEKWRLTLQSPMGAQTVVVSLDIHDGAMTGVMTGEDGDVPIKEGKAIGQRLQWKADVQKPIPLTLAFDVARDGDTLSGKFKPGVFPPATLTGVRIPDTPRT